MMLSSTVIWPNSARFWKVRPMPTRGALAGRHAGDVGAVEADLPLGRAVAAGDAIDHGGLAGAIRADDGEHLAARDLKETSVSARTPPKRSETCSAARIGGPACMRAPSPDLVCSPDAYGCRKRPQQRRPRSRQPASLARGWVRACCIAAPVRRTRVSCCRIIRNLPPGTWPPRWKRRYVSFQIDGKRLCDGLCGARGNG